MCNYTLRLTFGAKIKEEFIIHDIRNKIDTEVNLLTVFNSIVSNPIVWILFL